MIKNLFYSSVLLLVLFRQGEAFVVHHPISNSIGNAPTTKYNVNLGSLNGPTRHSRSQLFLADEEETDGFDGGIQRGIPLLVLVMVINIWLFSIPVEFRRGHCK